MIVDYNIWYQFKTRAYVLLLQLVSPRVMFKLVFFGSNYILFVVHVNTLVLTELMKSEIFENHIIIKNKS